MPEARIKSKLPIEMVVRADELREREDFGTPSDSQIYIYCIHSMRNRSVRSAETAYFWSSSA
jgi:hypothetical protein